MIKNLEKKNTDLTDWEKFLEDPGRIHNKDNDEVTDFNSNKKFRFDFHGYSIEKANSTIDQIISKCFKNGVQQILVITGKGIHSDTDQNVYVSQKLSKLRYSVPEYINSNPNLLNFVSTISMAKLEDGGDGAIVIKLKKL